MTTNPAALAQLAACYTGIPKGDFRAALLISILAQWVKKQSNNPISFFAYTPITASISWHETVAGTKTATSLSGFYTKYISSNVDSINLSNKGITSISNLSSLPNLLTLIASTNPAITSVDFTGCTKLKNVQLSTSGLTTIDISTAPSLQIFNVSHSSAFTTLVGGTNHPSLVSVDVSFTPLISLDLHGSRYVTTTTFPMATYYNVNGCALPNTFASGYYLNAIIFSFITDGTLGGFADVRQFVPTPLSTGGNNGITAKAILQAESPPWTILSD